MYTPDVPPRVSLASCSERNLYDKCLQGNTEVISALFIFTSIAQKAHGSYKCILERVYMLVVAVLFDGVPCENHQP